MLIITSGSRFWNTLGMSKYPYHTSLGPSKTKPKGNFTLSLVQQNLNPNSSILQT